MNPLRHPRLFAACVLTGTLINIHAVRADFYTYSLNAPTGYGGGTVTGVITFSGNTSNPVPGLNTASAFALAFTPSIGPIQTFSQTDVVAVNYNPAIDFGSGLLGDSTLTAATIPSGLDYWAVTNGSVTTLDLYLSPTPYGPSWETKNPNPIDYVYGTWSLDLQSHVVTPEPGVLMALVPVGAMLLLRRRRQAV